MKYLITTECGDSFAADSVSEEDLVSSSYGLITIFDIEKELVHFDGDQWHAMKAWGENNAT